jgi:hypothetical protein
LIGFFNAIELVMEEGFALTALVCLILNLFIAEEIEDEETPELTADLTDIDKDDAEWGRLHSVSQPRKTSHDDATAAGAAKAESEGTSHANEGDIEKAAP